jgi:teichuronic acid biosynthesis glycosyltransferase TuaC
MKVLHVSSANKSGINPIIRTQVSFLEMEGVQVDYFGIKGKFLWGYPGSVSRLRQYIHYTKPDVIHAHYSYSGYSAMLAGAKPLIIP